MSEMTAMDILELHDQIAALVHYGTPRHSGRYPWGSGDNPYQRQKNFYSHVKALKEKGFTQAQIAKAMDMSTTELRAKISNAKQEMRSAERAELQRLVSKGYSVNAAAKRVGVPEPTARNLLSDASKAKEEKANKLANLLKEQVEKKGYLDVGQGTAENLEVSSTKLANTIHLLEEQGYKIQYIKTEQLGTGKETSLKVLTKEDVSWKELNENKDKIRPVTDTYYDSEQDEYRTKEPPRSISSDTIEVNYTHDDGTGGAQKDGLIEIRRGVEELSLGNANYAQVRIAVDDGYYMKGMAVYADDLPEGINVRYNTNRVDGTPMFENPDPMGETVFKKMKSDPNNLFGATIKEDDELIRCQRHYIDADGNEQLSAINVVNEEGNWSDWSRTLSAQMLSKQPPGLAKQQLDMAYDQKVEEYDEICSLTNPTVQKHLLESFADDCDSSAVHLKAAAIPGTASHVLIPFPEMKDGEIYAPNYPDGTKVALIRYPHGGLHEIPILTVNNNYAPAKDTLGNASDAVGINRTVAQKLSGADFDGDTVAVIPNNDGRVKSRADNEMSASLRKLKDFDPTEAYPGYPGMKVISEANKQKKMGEVSNLITDMTIKGATDDEIARAVRHSMVVIDAAKHKLNYQQSYIDNDIAALKAKYQGVDEAGHLKGASTLISRAKSPERVYDRKEGQWVVDEDGKGHRQFYDPKTGSKLYEELPGWTDKEGGVHKKTIKSTKMMETTDAYTLTSGGSKENPGTKIEAIYAEHANRLKALANRARLKMLSTPDIEYNSSAHKVYAAEVSSLRKKLDDAVKNAPLERQAQLLANRIYQSKKESDPHMSKDQEKKIRGQALKTARERVGAKKTRIDITDREWKAIQSGAVSKSFLNSILKNSDLDIIKQRATPRTTKKMSSAKITRARSMLANGHSQAVVAEVLGVSVSTLMRSISGED